MNRRISTCRPFALGWAATGLVWSLACGGGGGSATGSPAAPPTISAFAATPDTLPMGSSTTLAWRVEGATSLRLDPLPGPVNGRSLTLTPEATTTYVLTAAGPGGSVTRTATVTLTPALRPPEITAFTALPQIVAPGESFRLVWTTPTGSKLALGAQDVTGRVDLGMTQTATTTHTLSAQTAQGTTTARTTVPVIDPDGGRIQVRTGHPRLLVNPDLMTAIRGKAKALADLAAFVKTLAMTRTTDPTDTTTMRLETDALVAKHLANGLPNDALYIGVNAYFNPTPLTQAYARQYVESLLAISFPDTDPNDGPPRDRLYALGLFYDWLYDSLDAASRARVRRAILDQIDDLDRRWAFFRQPLSTGGHSRWAQTGGLLALLAIRDDLEGDAEADRTKGLADLGRIAGTWREGYLAYHRQAGLDGGHPFGWAYGTSYATPQAMLAWRFATRETDDWLMPWFPERTYWYLYGLRNAHGASERLKGGYDSFEYWGDTWATNLDHLFQGAQLTVAGFLGNSHARWLVHALDGKGGGGFPIWDLLYRHWAATEEQSPADLPLARHFRGTGMVLVRDRWDFAENTLLTFRSAPFFVENHSHRDQNAFTLFYRAPLAIDSGGYNVMGAYGSMHWLNYYTRTVAHNAILVFDPNEDFGTSPTFGKLSNDGGQRAFPRGYPSVSDLLPDGANHLGGIGAFEQAAGHVVMMGDATRAYAPSKVKDARRWLVYLPNHSGTHPAVLVYDRVVATQSTFAKTYLLHTMAEPTLTGRIASTEAHDGMDPKRLGGLWQETLLPKDAVIAKIGGPTQAFWVADDGTGKGHDYREGCLDNDPRALREAGQWRVEVKPGTPRLEDRFLHVLSITEGLAGQVPAQATLLTSGNLEGALVVNPAGSERTAVLFRVPGSSMDETLELRDLPPFSRILLVNLSPGSRLRVARSGSQLLVAEDPTGPHLASAEGVLLISLP